MPSFVPYPAEVMLEEAHWLAVARECLAEQFRMRGLGNSIASDRRSKAWPRGAFADLIVLITNDQVSKSSSWKSRYSNNLSIFRIFDCYVDTAISNEASRGLVVSNVADGVGVGTIVTVKSRKPYRQETGADGG
jgi:hypothetical protein